MLERKTVSEDEKKDELAREIAEENAEIQTERDNLAQEFTKDGNDSNPEDRARGNDTKVPLEPATTDKQEQNESGDTHLPSNQKCNLSNDEQQSSVHKANGPQSSIVEAYYRVEKACFESVKRALGNTYDVIQGVKTPRGILDFVAISKTAHIDLLFEVKYITKHMNYNLLKKASDSLVLQASDYKNEFGRECLCVLIVVHKRKEDYESPQKRAFTNYVARQNNSRVIFVEYNDLATVGERTRKMIA